MVLYLQKKNLTSWNEVQFYIKITVMVQVMLENKITPAYNGTSKGRILIPFYAGPA